MFVRWKKRPYALGRWEGITYSAYLVESKRMGDKVSQKNLGYLGSIRRNNPPFYFGKEEWSYGISCQCTDEEGDLARAAFYTALRSRLDWLHIAEQEQVKVERQIAKTVPHLTPEQCEALRKQKRERQAASFAAFRRSQQV